MRIVIISFTGHERYSIQLANAMATGNEVTLISPNNESIKFKDYVNENIELVTYNRVNFFNPKNIFIMVKIVKIIKKNNPDVIHFQGSTVWQMIGIPFLKNYWKVTTLHDVRTHFGEEKLRYPIQKLIGVMNSDRIIVHGSILKKILSDEFPKKKDCIFVIPHGNYSYFNKMRKDDVIEEDGKILFFGRLFRYKGLEYLIKAEPFITKEIPNYRVEIICHGEPIDDYLKYITDESKYSIHQGFVDDREVSKYFKRASIVVLPYVEGSQSGVLNVAYSFGKPVIGTNVGSLPEAIIDGITGFIVPPKDEKKLAEAIIYLLKDRKLRIQMGKNAYEMSRSDLSWENISRKTLKVYDH